MKIEVVDGGPVPFRATPYSALSVIGAGAWGTALAATAARSGARVRLWGRNRQVVNDINRTRTNARHLPEVPLPGSLVAVHEMANALDGADAVLIVVPSRSIRSVARQVAEYIGPGVPVAVCAKGIEDETGLLMSQVAEEELGARPIGTISSKRFTTSGSRNITPPRIFV